MRKITFFCLRKPICNNNNKKKVFIQWQNFFVMFISKKKKCLEKKVFDCIKKVILFDIRNSVINRSKCSVICVYSCIFWWVLRYLFCITSQVSFSWISNSPIVAKLGARQASLLLLNAYELVPRFAFKLLTLHSLFSL
jgi:hypothetical protein